MKLNEILAEMRKIVAMRKTFACGIPKHDMERLAGLIEEAQVVIETKDNSLPRILRRGIE